MARCTAKITWNADEYLVAMQRHYSLTFRREFRTLLKVTCALLLVFVAFLVVVGIFLPYDKPAPYWAFALVGIICGYGLIYHHVNEWYWKRKFRKRPQPTEIEWVFSDDVVQMRTSLGEATLKWEAYLKVVEVQDGFLFYPMKNMFSWIPFVALESVECIATMREMIVRNKCPFTQR